MLVPAATSAGLLQRLLATVDEVSDVLLVPPGLDDADAHLRTVQFAERDLALRGLNDKRNERKSYVRRGEGWEESPTLYDASTTTSAARLWGIKNAA